MAAGRALRMAPARVVPFLLLLSATCTPQVATTVGPSVGPSDSPAASAPTSSVSQAATPTTGPTSSQQPTPTQPPVGMTGDSFVLDPPEGGAFLVRGRYPRIKTGCKNPARPNLVARYHGRLTAERAEDGTITVTATLPFEEYLKGIAEVPASWPMEALKAQVIAARTYALARTGWTGEGEDLDRIICSSSSCQVYRGEPVPKQPELKRWYRAVRSTEGQVLIFRGRPAETLYFSTSNGRTLSNEEVFGSSPLPYLRSVKERDDGESSTSRWTVKLPYDDLGLFLSKAKLWPSGSEIARVERIGSSVRVAGSGRERTLSVADFRAAVNQWSECLMPDRYPGDSRSGTPLPVAVPSIWFSAKSGPGSVALVGRGWGHGVGMTQWGAYGKAKRGMSAAEILAAYYGGLRPKVFPEPRTIRVQIATGLATLSALPSGEGARVDGEGVGAGPIVIGGGESLWLDAG